MHPFITEQLIADRHAQALADASRSRLVRCAANNRPLPEQAQPSPGWRRRLAVSTLALVARIVPLAARPDES